MGHFLWLNQSKILLMVLSRRIKSGYGTAELGLAGGELLLQLYLLEFYIRSMGLSPVLTGVALALAVLWDAATDPLMGGILDRTRSRWGRFIPYLFLGGLLFGVGLVTVFNPPAELSDPALFMYLLITYIFVNTGLTMIGIPHIALGGVLSSDTDERTDLYGWRLVFGTIGLFAGILSPLIAIQLFGVSMDESGGFGDSRRFGSLIMGFLVIVTAAITILAIWEKSIKLPAPEKGFRWQDLWSNLHRVGTNPVFIPFFAAFLLVGMGRTLNSTLALPYYKDSLNLDEKSVQGPILSTFAISIVLSIPAWSWLGRRFGKKRPAFVGLLVLGLMTIIAYPLFPQGELMGPVFAAVIGGFAVGAIILVESLVTDIADKDFVDYGEDREGIYFGYWRMGQKMARSLTIGFAGLLLGWIGYEESLIEQTVETNRSLALLFGGGVGGLFLAASLIFLFVPISHAEQKIIQKNKEALLNPKEIDQ